MDCSAVYLSYKGPHVPEEMKKQKKVYILRRGNQIAVSPTTSTIRNLLIPELTFVERKMLRGREARIAKHAGQSQFVAIDHECWFLDRNGLLVTSYGFWSRVYDKLAAAGYRVSMRQRKISPEKSRRYKIYWERLSQFSLRAGQPEFFAKLLSRDCGRFSAPPGFGKSFAMRVIGTLLPHARIDIVAKEKSVLYETLYVELAAALPDVGIVGAGKNVRGRRIMCYMADSLHKSDGDADILIADEAHQLCTDRYAERLGRYLDSWNYGLSASLDMRPDGLDFRSEAVFGPTVFTMTYREAQEAGLVVPITVFWSNVIMDFDPESGCREHERDLFGIWANEHRNSVIAEDARRYDASTQVLINVDKVEHAVRLKSLLPEYTLVYGEASMDLDRLDAFKRSGLLPPEEELVTSERRHELTKLFKAGKLTKVISTVFKTGVNSPTLGVVIRGDGQSSPISDIQVPGRASRITGEKSEGIIHDYLDQFNSRCRRKAKRRQKSYEGQQWTQVFPRGTYSEPNQLSLYDDDLWED